MQHPYFWWERCQVLRIGVHDSFTVCTVAQQVAAALTVERDIVEARQLGEAGGYGTVQPVLEDLSPEGSEPTLSGVCEVVSDGLARRGREIRLCHVEETEVLEVGEGGGKRARQVICIQP